MLTLFLLYHEVRADYRRTRRQARQRRAAHTIHPAMA